MQEHCDNGCVDGSHYSEGYLNSMGCEMPCSGQREWGGTIFPLTTNTKTSEITSGGAVAYIKPYPLRCLFTGNVLTLSPCGRSFPQKTSTGSTPAPTLMLTECFKASPEYQ